MRTGPVGLESHSSGRASEIKMASLGVRYRTWETYRVRILLALQESRELQHPELGAGHTAALPRGNWRCRGRRGRSCRRLKAYVKGERHMEPAPACPPRPYPQWGPDNTSESVPSGRTEPVRDQLSGPRLLHRPALKADACGRSRRLPGKLPGQALQESCPRAIAS